jgi:hypothetical protein
VLWKQVNNCNTLGLSSTCAVIPAVLICRESRSTHFSSAHSIYYCSAQYTGPEQQRFHSYHGRSLKSHNGQNCLRCQQLHCLADTKKSKGSFFILKHPAAFFYVTNNWHISLYVTQVLHNWKGVTYWCVHSFRGKKGPNKPSRTQHTTHQPWHQVMALQGLMMDFLQMNTFYSETSHIDWDVIKVFTTQDMHGAYSASMYPMKVPVHKIQSCFTIYVTVFVNYGCIVWVQMQLFWCISCWLHRYPYPMSKSNQRFSCRCLKPSTNFIQSFFSQRIFCVFSYCLQWNLLLKTFSHNCTLSI